MERLTPSSNEPEPTPKELTPEEQYDQITADLRRSMDKGMVSFIDSDAYRLAEHLQNHPELSGSPEELQMRLEVLNTIVAAAWGTMDKEEALRRLTIPRLESEKEDETSG